METQNPNQKEENDLWLDQSLKAGQILNYIIQGDSPEARKHNENRVGVLEAMHDRPILDNESGRTLSRVLFVTRDEAFLEERSEVTQTMKQLATLFDEIHVMLLIPRRGKDRSVRISKNMWVYHTHYRYWWQLLQVPIAVAEENLVFDDIFRPDIVVGYDCFEEGLVGYMLAQKFERAFQLHVRTDWTHKDFFHTYKHPTIRTYLAKWLIRRAESVRATLSKIQESVRLIDEKKEVYLLPTFFNFEGLMHAEPSFNVHKKYQDFSFIILVKGELRAHSPLHDLFSELHPLLHNPRLGMVVIGDGPGRELFRKKVQILDIEKNVIFVPRTDDELSYLKTADVLIEIDTSSESEKWVLKAAAAGLPIIARETVLRNDLFTDGVSAFLCPKDEAFCIKQKLNKFLNYNAFRLAFKVAAQSVIETRLAENASAYYTAYRDSIEYALLSTMENDISSKDEQLRGTTQEDTITEQEAVA